MPSPTSEGPQRPAQPNGSQPEPDPKTVKPAGSQYVYAVTDGIVARIAADNPADVELFDKEREEWYRYRDLYEFYHNHRLIEPEEAARLMSDAHFERTKREMT